MKGSPRLKRFLDYLIMNQRDARPRWYVRLLTPLYQHRGWGSKIYWSVRLDTPPYRRFWLGKRSVVESYCCINNAVGDVTIGDHTRIGIHCTVIGPVCIGNHVNLAQGITVMALNHNFSDTTQRTTCGLVPMPSFCLASPLVATASLQLEPSSPRTCPTIRLLVVYLPKSSNR